MKRLSILFLIIIFLSTLFVKPRQASAAVLSKAPNNLGLAGYWKFDGNYTGIPDSSGNGNTGTLNGSPGFVSGRYGNARNFSGSSDYMAITSISIPADWTIMTWFYYPLTNTGSWRTLARGASADHQVIVDVNLYLGTFDNGGTGFHSSGYNMGSLSTGWHFLAAAGSGSSTAFYIDGASVGSANFKSSSQISYIGNYQGGGQQFGIIDELRIYTRSLTSTEISNVYKSGFVKMSSSQNSRMTSGLLGLWSFDGADVSGTTVYDRSGNGRNGTVYSASYGPGKYGQGFNDPGTGYVETTGIDTIGIINASFTACAWINGASYNAGGDNNVFGVDQTGTNLGLHLTIRGKVPYFGFYANDTGGVTTLVEGRWYNICWRYNISNGEQAIYVNGNLDNSSTGHAALQGWASLKIGRQFGGSYFNGTIDDARIYNYPLSAAEIQKLYSLGAVKMNSTQNSKLTSGLVGYWPFNGPDISGTTAYDRSGQNNNGTLYNNPSGAIGKVGQAINFNGSNQYVSAPFNGFSSGMTDVTISFWAYPRSSGTNNALFSESTDDTSNRLLIHFPWSDNNIYWDFGNISAGGRLSVGFNPTWFNQWGFYTFTAQNGVGMKVYRNGSLLASSGSSSAFSPAGRSLYLANLQTTGVYWNGILDEVRIYNRALSSSEISQLYMMGK